jgi:hypothetical protein
VLKFGFVAMLTIINHKSIKQFLRAGVVVVVVDVVVVVVVVVVVEDVVVFVVDVLLIVYKIFISNLGFKQKSPCN